MFKNQYKYIEQYSKKYLGQYIHDFPKKIDSSNLIYRDNIDYTTNSLGFRSKEFYNLMSDNYNILYSGCSNTYGEGLPLNLTWTSILTEEIKKYKPNVDSFNIGYGAASIHSIIRNTLAFIENYGKPDIIFMLLPPPVRNLAYSEKHNGFVNCILWDKFLLLDNHIQKDFYIKHISEDKNLFALTVISMFESICKYSNIKLIWSTWDKKSNDLYKKINFEYFLPMDQRYDKKIENINNLEYWEKAADGDHPGAMWSTQFVSQNLEEFLSRGYDK